MLVLGVLVLPTVTCNVNPIAFIFTTRFDFISTHAFRIFSFLESPNRVKKVYRSKRSLHERAALCGPEFLTPTTNSEDGAGGRKQNLSLLVSPRLRVLNLGKQ